jgi:two-component sensor histidine kinase
MPETEPIRSELRELLLRGNGRIVLDAILTATPSIAVIVDGDGTVLRVSRHACALSHRTAGEMEGLTVAEFAALVQPHDRSRRPLRMELMPIVRALQGEVVIGLEGSFVDGQGEHVPIVSNAAPFRNEMNEVIGAITSVTDLRKFRMLEGELREAVAAKDTLYRELTHRVKNHLQIMTALVTLEAGNPALSAKDLAGQIKGQLQALAAVYKGMDRAEAGARIEARPFLEEVCCPYATGEVSVDAEVTPPDLTLTSELAGPVGMLVNEAVCNSHKHAFPDHHGRIHVSLVRREPGRLRVEVADDGVGWGAVDPSKASHGLDLMRLFARQMHGDLELGVDRRGGALVTAEVPETVE